jgi:murein DD-endopeptidase MepM/ murein hydrolase activator NlpD
VKVAEAETCSVCGGDVGRRAGLVLVGLWRRRVHCSETCLREGVRRARARSAARRRWALGAAALAAVVVTTTSVVRRHRAQRPRAISLAWPDAHGPLEPPTAPVLIGPPWPPTDEQWLALFDRAAWTHPLPGPDRRPAIADMRIFAAPAREHPARCRNEASCGVDLGGELWGEHVYAALDGVVERVHDDERHGGMSVRLVHFGGAVFTQYFHLAATPRTLTRGSRVNAGDVIGLLGDTGLDGERRHLDFALSVRPAPVNELPEVYWDPTQWLARATLRRPLRGTVAGYMPPEKAAHEIDGLIH